MLSGVTEVPFYMTRDPIGLLGQALLQDSGALTRI